MNGFKKFSRTWWVLASADGCLLAKGNLNPKMPPYHLDAMTDQQKGEGKCKYGN